MATSSSSHKSNIALSALSASASVKWWKNLRVENQRRDCSGWMAERKGNNGNEVDWLVWSGVEWSVLKWSGVKWNAECNGVIRMG